MKKEVLKIKIADIKVNPNQPRQEFDNDSIVELRESIKENGLIQPIIVRLQDNGFELVAGERRLRACKQLGLEYIDGIVEDYDEETSAKIAIIENIQRENLSAIEEAIAFEKLIKEHNYTQQQLATSLGKSQSTIANKIRLLNLNSRVKEGILTKEITERHGRALLKITDENLQVNAYNKIVRDNMNVEKSEEYIESIIKPKEKPLRKKIISKNDYRLEINTIMQSLDLIRKAGVNVEYDMEDLEQGIKIEIVLTK
ncbi:ParB/RepB/Spo0J family partition protein [Erysipelotrichaceae bacterium OttesenSCG-928-M19]|nr:ParB/RepB/Spo0J family partition protein [Erysipelotrichaceae bacterium OttesenSCG-928-M19]